MEPGTPCPKMMARLQAMKSVDSSGGGGNKSSNSGDGAESNDDGSKILNRIRSKEGGERRGDDDGDSAINSKNKVRRLRDTMSFDSNHNVLIPKRIDILRKMGLKVESVGAGPNGIMVVCSGVVIEDNITQTTSTDNNIDIKEKESVLKSGRKMRKVDDDCNYDDYDDQTEGEGNKDCSQSCSLSSSCSSYHDDLHWDMGMTLFEVEKEVEYIKNQNLREKTDKNKKKDKKRRNVVQTKGFEEKVNAITCCTGEIAPDIDIQTQSISSHVNKNTSNDYNTDTTIFTVGNTTATTSLVEDSIEISLAQKVMRDLSGAVLGICISGGKDNAILNEDGIEIEKNCDVPCDDIKDLSKMEEGGVELAADRSGDVDAGEENNDEGRLKTKNENLKINNLDRES